jgi:hypothetical protein
MAAVEVDAGVAEVDAGAVEPVDAGVPFVEPPRTVAVGPVDVPESGGLGAYVWQVLVGLGVLAALLLFIARRRSNPRDPG